jgi:hypothetical protein
MGTLPGRVEFQEGHKDLADRSGHCSPHYSWLAVGKDRTLSPTTYSPAVLLYSSFMYLTHFISAMSVRLGKRQTSNLFFLKEQGGVQLKPCLCPSPCNIHNRDLLHKSPYVRTTYTTSYPHFRCLYCPKRSYASVFVNVSYHVTTSYYNV